MRTPAPKSASPTNAAQPETAVKKTATPDPSRRISRWADAVQPAFHFSRKVNTPGDQDEQAADRIAGQVMGMAEVAVQRSPGEGNGQTAALPRTAAPAIQQTLQQPGKPLDGPTRNFMESRFGQDFGRVRIHSNRVAANSAEAIHANAYTLGQDIVFNQGQYRPGSVNGRHLLAHELTHVIQQRQGPVSLVQRDEPDGKPAGEQPGTTGQQTPRKDIVFVMDFEPAAKLASPDAQYIPVKSPQEMAAALKAISAPVGTIYIFSHSSAAANIKFPSTGYVSASFLAKIIKDRIDPKFAPQVIDFRGCSVGMNPAGMEEIRQATGAGAIVGSTCYIVFMTLPFKVNDVHITKKSQLKNEVNKATWDKHFKNHWKKFDSKECVLDKGKEAYFRAGGYLVSIFANKEYTTAYSPTDSVCFKDLTKQEISPQDALTKKPDLTETCKLIRVEATPQAPPAQGPATQPTTQPAVPAPAAPAPAAPAPAAPAPAAPAPEAVVGETAEDD